MLAGLSGWNDGAVLFSAAGTVAGLWMTGAGFRIRWGAAQARSRIAVPLTEHYSTNVLFVKRSDWGNLEDGEECGTEGLTDLETAGRGRTLILNGTGSGPSQPQGLRMAFTWQ